MKLNRYGLLSLLSAIALSGCISLAPDYERPQTQLPEQWEVPAGHQPAGTSERWWTVFGDPVLDRLVDEALAHNTDLQLAIARVDEARALYGDTRGQQFPVVYGSGDANRLKSSDRTSTPQPEGTPRERDNYRAAVVVSYELDLWGRFRDATKVARAELLATDAARETVRITVITEVIQGYYLLRALDEQYAATRRSLTTREESLTLQKLRYDKGVISEWEYRQIEAEVAAAQAQLPVIERQRAAQEGVLALLLGREPRSMFQENVVARSAVSQDGGAAGALLVPAGIPSDLLLRRPDLIEAEQGVIAANLRIGVARSSLFPSIELTGLLGSESASLSSLFASGAGIWQVAAALTQPIWAGGRLRTQIQAANARQRQAVAVYRKTIQNAFREIRDAIIAQSQSRQQFEAESRRVDALREALRLAKVRYENGIASQLDLFDAERNLLSAEINRSDALRIQRAAVADMFKALGGDWTFDPEKLPRGSLPEKPK